MDELRRLWEKQLDGLTADVLDVDTVILHLLAEVARRKLEFPDAADDGADALLYYCCVSEAAATPPRYRFGMIWSQLFSTIGLYGFCGSSSRGERGSRAWPVIDGEASGCAIGVGVG
eukprot:CAMPEP_0115763742 /NCGR_PEP_ID=MMETSP0272-20121206/101699_1 /TAXON_ID=71861 /ORGANISM="Scrippsiella trochoidea, Strain CCMP3099" /LENGTH=116 /DNA_ID=CAMNT_0003209503 /DNA_START=144 /DNA_END=492 /DNA_ORIENTATION=-